MQVGCRDRSACTRIANVLKEETLKRPILDCPSLAIYGYPNEPSSNVVCNL